MKSFSIRIDGKAYYCEVEEVAAEAESGNSVYAPLSGRVVGLGKSPGDPVRRGEPIMVLDAGRTEILAPCSGKMSVIASDGELVSKGDFLALVSD